MISQHFTPYTILINLHVDHWAEAVQAAGQLLLDAGKCNEQYVQAMVNAVNEFGPYMVLAPGLALVHARPEDGVLDVGVSLVTLDPPVNFGSKENDPVSLVVAFCAVDKTSHVEMLAGLAGFLEDEERRSKLARVNQPEMAIRELRLFDKE